MRSPQKIIGILLLLTATLVWAYIHRSADDPEMRRADVNEVATIHSQPRRERKSIDPPASSSTKQTSEATVQASGSESLVHGLSIVTMTRNGTPISQLPVKIFGLPTNSARPPTIVDAMKAARLSPYSPEKRRTDASGRTTIPVSPQPRIAIVSAAKKIGFLYIDSGSQPGADIPLFVDPAAILRGKIVSDRRSAIPNARIRMQSAADFGELASATSDDGGCFTIEGIPMERTSIVASAAGHTSRRVTFDVLVEDPPDLEIVLPRAVKIEGKYELCSIAPDDTQSAALTDESHLEICALSGDGSATATDDFPKAIYAELDPQRRVYRVTVSAEYRALAAVSQGRKLSLSMLKVDDVGATSVDGPLISVPFRMRGTIPVTIEVEKDKGDAIEQLLAVELNPLPNAKVVDFLKSATSDDDRSFVAEIPAGSWRFQIRTTRCRHLEKIVAVEPPSSLVRFSVPSISASLAGAVSLHEAAPPRPLQLRVTQNLPAGNSLKRTAPVNADLTFDLDGLCEGPAEIQINDGAGIWCGATVTLSAGVNHVTLSAISQRVLSIDAGVMVRPYRVRVELSKQLVVVDDAETGRNHSARNLQMTIPKCPLRITLTSVSQCATLIIDANETEVVVRPDDVLEIK